MGRRAAIAGASGLVGAELLKLLLESPEIDAVAALVRRPLGIKHAKLREHLVDFADAASMRAALEEAKPQDLHCCLGTTIKKAGSQAAFRAVDLEAPLTFAKEGLAAGAEQYVLCSAAGANPRSRVFYSRTKGESEEGGYGIGFSRGVKIVRPSMLLGERKEHRPLERALMLPLKLLAPILRGPLWKYRPIQASMVARAMFNAALREMPGDRLYEGKSLFTLAGFA